LLHRPKPFDQELTMSHSFSGLRAAALCLAFAFSASAFAQPTNPAGKTPPGLARKAVKVITLGPKNAAVENIAFLGDAVVSSRLAADPELGTPMFVIAVDMSGVTGVGRMSKRRYVTTAQEFILRPHVVNHDLNFTFALFTDENALIENVRTVEAHLVLNVDLVTGDVTSLAMDLAPLR
jgi:hypothetical protein